MSSSDHSADPAAHSVSRRVRRRPGENRARLIEAGIRVFAQHGYHGASTSAIATLADVPQPHVYASFRTKQDLFFECGNEVVTRLREFDFHIAPSAPLSPDLQVLGQFVLQCIAHSHDTKLQPQLGELLRRLSAPQGTGGLSLLVTAAATGILRSQHDVHGSSAPTDA